MAVFVPKLDICFKACSIIKFVDITNVYSATTNTGGWESSVGGDDISTAVITVYDDEDELVFTYTVTSEIPDTVTGDIAFTEYDDTELDDGEYTLIYTLTTSASTIYTYTKKFLNCCNFEACIDSLIATIPEKICENRCDTEYIDDVLTIEALLYGYKCAAQCDKDTIKTEIEKKLERFCDFQCDY